MTHKIAILMDPIAEINIKKDSSFAMLVIMLSSKDGLFDRAKGRIVGSDQYLTKPFSRDELLGAISQHVTNA